MPIAQLRTYTQSFPELADAKLKSSHAINRILKSLEKGSKCLMQLTVHAPGRDLSNGNQVPHCRRKNP